jgi:hypothetical protein
LLSLIPAQPEDPNVPHRAVRDVKFGRDTAKLWKSDLPIDAARTEGNGGVSGWRLSAKLQRGCSSFSVEEDTDSASLLCSLTAYKLYTRVWARALFKDSRGSNTLNKASELYASKCELNVLLLSAAEPPVV